MEEHTRQPLSAPTNGKLVADADDSLKSLLERLVTEGVEQGLITIDESGLAQVAPLPPAPSQPSPDAPWAEHKAWSAHPWFARFRRARDLDLALQCPGMQEIALRQLSATLVPTGVYDQLLALSLLRDLTPVAGGMAPEAALRRARPALEAQAEAFEGERIWYSALKNAFLVVPRTGRAREQVEWVLDLLRAGTTDLPPVFRRPTVSHLAAADRVMRSLSANNPGRRKGRWGMARAFAEAFGCELPARERDARRRKGARSRLG